MAVHDNVAAVVDVMLRGQTVVPEVRWVDEEGKLHKSREGPPQSLVHPPISEESKPIRTSAHLTRVLPFGVSKDRVEQVVQGAGLPVQVVDNIGRTDILLTTKQFFRKKPKLVKAAEEAGKSIFVLRKNTLPQVEQFLLGISRENGWEDPVMRAIREAEAAAEQVLNGHDEISLNPQVARIRRLQHEIAQRHDLSSVSTGREPYRRVTISRR